MKLLSGIIFGALLTIGFIFVPKFLQNRPDTNLLRQNEIALKELAKALDMYLFDCKQYPASLKNLVEDDQSCEAWEAPYISDLPEPKDAYGHNYIYESDGEIYRLKSLGKDGKEGGMGLDADIQTSSVNIPADFHKKEITYEYRSPKTSGDCSADPKITRRALDAFLRKIAETEFEKCGTISRLKEPANLKVRCDGKDVILYGAYGVECYFRHPELSKAKFTKKSREDKKDMNSTCEISSDGTGLKHITDLDVAEWAQGDCLDGVVEAKIKERKYVCEGGKLFQTVSSDIYCFWISAGSHLCNGSAD